MAPRIGRALRLASPIVATLLLLVGGSIGSAKADWLNLTGAETAPNIAEIYIHDAHVRVVLEVYIGDIDTFHDLVPDDWLREPDSSRLSEADRMMWFSSEVFKLVTDSGETLQGRIELVEPRERKDRFSPFAGMINPMTRQPVPHAPADKRVLYAEIDYPLEGEPSGLTIVPPLDENGRAVVTVGFIAYHKSVPVIDFRYLGAPARLALDWTDPWYSKFDHPNLTRHHKHALMSYLYVEPYEVRHEILTRVKDLAQWMDLSLSGDRYIELDELEPLKQRIGAFLLAKNLVQVDGAPLKPILDRVNYVTVSLNGIQLMEKPERLDLSTAIVGVIIAYITDGLPQTVTVDWDLFTDRIQRVPATSVDPAGPLLTFVTPEDNVHAWRNHLKTYRLPAVEQIAVADALTTMRLPVGTILSLAALVASCFLIRARRRNRQSTRLAYGLGAAALMIAVGAYPYFYIAAPRPAAVAPRLTAADGTALLHSLLKNVYRAFDFRDEDDVYDKLALSVSGDLLTDFYLQNRRSFAIQRAGGAQAKIKDVEVLNTELAPAPGRGLAHTFRTQWTASGSVGHWGHVHTRKNLYDAEVTVEPVDGSWKITGLEVLEEQRVDPFAATGSSDLSGQ